MKVKGGRVEWLLCGDRGWGKGGERWQVKGGKGSVVEREESERVEWVCWWGLGVGG